ncbi:MAG TPA: hypothetical protein VGB74_15705, partial [Actinoplanes sp.]
MEDENADRVYVPGTPTPPARDVEPFWAAEELEPPVHGGRPVPHEPPPAIPLTNGGPAGSGVYRPTDRPIPVPPPAHVPVPPPATVPVPRRPVGSPTQAWPNLEPTADGYRAHDPDDSYGGAPTQRPAGPTAQTPGGFPPTPPGGFPPPTHGGSTPLSRGGAPTPSHGSAPTPSHGSAPTASRGGAPTPSHGSAPTA